MRGKSCVENSRPDPAPTASMRPAHYAREVEGKFRLYRVGGEASMRPAHYAREVLQDAEFSRRGILCFNEARALCAGSRVGRRHSAAAAAASMRPAHYAREVSNSRIRSRRSYDASMRPAHYAREVKPEEALAMLEAGSFNEARALCAGSRRVPPLTARRRTRLQ